MTSAQTWRQLGDRLEEELQAYERLEDILHEEWTLLRNLDYENLMSVTAQKENLLIQIGHLEKARTTCLRQVFDNADEEIPFDGLVNSSLPEANPAKHAIQQLVARGRDIKVLSDRNSRLISRGLHVVREAMNVVHAGLGHLPMYGHCGQLMRPSVSTSLNVEG